MSEPPTSPVEGVSDDAPDDVLLTDIELVEGAPLRVRDWLGLPLFLVLCGIAGLVGAASLAQTRELRLAGWTLGVAMILVVAFAGLLAWSGRRAYLSMSLESVRRLIRRRLLGTWVISLAFLISGIVGGVWLLTLCAFAISLCLQLSFGLRPAEPDSEYARTARRLRPAFIAECVFAIVAPPVAALIAVNVDLPGKLASQYIADAIVVPVVAAIALIVILRRRSPRPQG